MPNISIILGVTLWLTVPFGILIRRPLGEYDQLCVDTLAYVRWVIYLEDIQTLWTGLMNFWHVVKRMVILYLMSTSFDFVVLNLYLIKPCIADALLAGVMSKST